MTGVWFLLRIGCYIMATRAVVLVCDPLRHRLAAWVERKLNR